MELQGLKILALAVMCSVAAMGSPPTNEEAERRIARREAIKRQIERRQEKKRLDAERRAQILQASIDAIRPEGDLSGTWFISANTAEVLPAGKFILLPDSHITIVDYATPTSRNITGRMWNRKDELAGVPGHRMEFKNKGGGGLKVYVEVGTHKRHGSIEAPYLRGACKWHPADDSKPERLVGKFSVWQPAPERVSTPQPQRKIKVDGYWTVTPPRYTVTTVNRPSVEVEIYFTAVRKGDDDELDDDTQGRRR